MPIWQCCWFLRAMEARVWGWLCQVPPVLGACLPVTIAPRTSWLSVVLVWSPHSITCKLNFRGNPRLWTSFLTLGTLFTPVVQLYQCLICINHLDSEGTKSHDGLFGRTLHQIPILLVCSVTLFVNISLFVILIDCSDYTFSPSLTIWRIFS